MATPALLNPAHALFLDFDGTLVDIAPSPDRIVVEPSLLASLQALQAALQGALAIVSGRPLHDIDRWLAPLRLPAAGVHGAERRGASGAVHCLPAQSLDAVEQAALRLVQAYPGLRLERKRAAVALHYREAPQLEELCREVFGTLVRETDGLELLEGKKVLEALPVGVNKGRAIEAFLPEAPFAGRLPVFIGDDVTDEAGFEAVQRLGGEAVKVGAGESVAHHRLSGAAEVRRWLAEAAAALDSRRTGHAANA